MSILTVLPFFRLEIYLNLHLEFRDKNNRQILKDETVSTKFEIPSLDSVHKTKVQVAYDALHDVLLYIDNLYAIYGSSRTGF